MTPQLMIQPSSWIGTGIRIEKVKNLNLFKFTEELQIRLESLLEKRKLEFLTSEEDLELAGLCELDRIFTLLNAKLIAEG
jgi:hypothetical protein